MTVATSKDKGDTLEGAQTGAQSPGFVAQPNPGGPETVPSTSTPPSEVGTEEGTTETTDAPRLFGGLTAKEAGERSALRRREREQAGEQDLAHERSDETLIVRTTVPTGAIIARLAKDAKGGNVQAARELRGWLAQLPVETDTDLSSLDRRTRQAVLARVLNELEQDEEGSTAGGEDEASQGE